MGRQLVVAALGLLCMSTGCTTMAKRTLKEFTGASSDAQTVPGSATTSFERFGGAEVSAPQTELGGLVSNSFMSLLATSLRKELTQGKDAPFSGGEPVLSIEPEVNWYHRGGGLFPDKYAVVLFRLRGEGADLGKVQVVTKSEASRTGDEDLAKDMAEELAGYFKKHGKKRKG
jgi:hypothetical protein